MSFLHLWSLITLISVSLLGVRLLPQWEVPGQDYVIIDLGRLPAGSAPDVLAINNKGQVIGNMVHWGIDSSFTDDGFLWEAGGLAPLPGLNGRYVYASALNDRGDIVGQVQRSERFGLDVLDTNETHLPVIWGEVRYHPDFLPTEMLYYIPLPLSKKPGIAHVINNKREIVGEEYDIEKNRPNVVKNRRYVLWRFLDAKGRKWKKTLLPKTWNRPLGILDGGEIIAQEFQRGTYRLGRWMRWKDGKQEPLPLPTEKTFTFNGLHGAGWLAGSWSNEKTKQSKPCLWKDDAIQELALSDGQSGTAKGVNKAGDAVGYFVPAQGKWWEQRACLWRKGKLLEA